MVAPKTIDKHDGRFLKTVNHEPLPEQLPSVFRPRFFVTPLWLSFLIVIVSLLHEAFNEGHGAKWMWHPEGENVIPWTVGNPFNLVLKILEKVKTCVDYVC